MATAKPKTTKIEAPTLEEVVIAEAVEEALVEEPVESVLEAPQAPVEEATPLATPFGSTPIWHGAMTGQNLKQRNQ